MTPYNKSGDARLSDLDHPIWWGALLFDGNGETSSLYIARATPQQGRQTEGFRAALIKVKLYMSLKCLGYDHVNLPKSKTKPYR